MLLAGSAIADRLVRKYIVTSPATARSTKATFLHLQAAGSRPAASGALTTSRRAITPPYKMDQVASAAAIEASQFRRGQTQYCYFITNFIHDSNLNTFLLRLSRIKGNKSIGKSK